MHAGSATTLGASTEEGESMKQHILVVDDSLTVRVDLRSALTAANFGVTLCESLAAAEQALARQSFAAVVLDIHLPDGDGIELLAKLRRDPELAATPILLLSSEDAIRARIRGLSRGADEYVGKPYDRARVIHRLRELIRGKGGDAPHHARHGGGGHRILTVDDSAMILAALSRALHADGYEVFTARSSEEALSVLIGEPVDGIILDLTMPGMGGLELCRRIRSLPDGRQIPLIVLTADGSSKARSAGNMAGADDYLVKSNDFGPLRARLRSLLHRKSHAARTFSCANTRRGDHRSSLLQQVTVVSGLRSTLAQSVLERACVRAGVDAASMSPEGLGRALALIRESLEVFLPAEEVTRRMRSITALAKVA